MPAIAALWLLLMASPVQTLHSGASGGGVSALQSVLLSQGFSPGPLDGQFGPMTAAAVSQFERAAGLAVNGSAGIAVFDGLVGRFAQGAPVLSEGASGQEVQALQALLNDDGQKLATDGNFGSLTLAAVEALQRSRGLRADGVVGPLTWQAIFSRIYPVAGGDTISLIAGRLGISSAWILAANGGSQEIYAGHPIVVPYAGWSSDTTPSTGQASTTSTSATNPAPAQTTTASSGNQSAGSGGATTTTTKKAKPKGFIPASALALWGNAGTPDIYVIALPTSADTLRAALTAAAQGSVAVALPTSLWSMAPASQRTMLATSNIADVEHLHPHWVVWLGHLSALDFAKISALGAKLLLAPPVTGTAQTVAARASGGRPLLVQLQPGQTALLGRLLQQLRSAGYRPLLLGQY